VFKLYLRKFVIVFFDDILVHNRDLEHHINHLRLVLQTLADNELFVKRSKCSFGVNQVEYLGHIISKDGVATDPTKIEVMLKWPVPSSVRELRGFLGLTGYYRKFVKNYGILARPLTDLLKKNGFKWGLEAQNSFEQLKTAMVTVPVLKLPDFHQPFTVETDACQDGIGAVLMQSRRPIAFLSKKLGPKHQALSTYEKELLALYTTVTKWRHYLMGGEFVIRTDQISLKYLLEQKVHSPMQHRGMSKLLGLNYKI
jgi:RNase H-like domain found in reverse transcriptase/Reverse transcriptase (RNA-dependent DNA polymerase)